MAHTVGSLCPAAITITGNPLGVLNFEEKGRSSSFLWGLVTMEMVHYVNCVKLIILKIAGVRME